MNTNLNPNMLLGAIRKTTNFLKSADENREKQIADYVNSKYNLVELPPIWPDKIAIAEKFSISLKKMPKDCISYIDKENKAIYLTNDKNLLEKWENFAISHVLGKWFMDHLGSTFDLTTITHMSGNKEDLQANKFASYLLMPDNFLREYAWLEEDFATVFRVPQEVVELRLLLT